MRNPYRQLRDDFHFQLFASVIPSCYPAIPLLIIPLQLHHFNYAFSAKRPPIPFNFASWISNIPVLFVDGIAGPRFFVIVLVHLSAISSAAILHYGLTATFMSI